ncbi:T6SS phospholipase effector Tle1-like catalytic domain-containing protein [Shewanella psychropiezotolerans]|nr:DUF2235 domain-containing protein [Shewanella psychropiezotolerans]
MSNQHCIACEQSDHWIEIDIRDENNHPFQGIKAFITDSGGNSQEVTLTGRPQLLNNLAPGIVTITLDTEPWLTESMTRKPRLESEDNQVVSYSDQKNGFSDTPKNYLHLTSGDLVTEPPKTPLPERHQTGKGDSGEYELFTNKSYVLEVKAFNWLTVRMGLFFDGTGNNTANALWAREVLEKNTAEWLVSCGADTVEEAEALQALCSKPVDPEIEGSAANELTNVYKLQQLYAVTKANKKGIEKAIYLTSLYINGIGTANEEPGSDGPAEDDILGSGFGRGERGVVARVEEGLETICKQVAKELQDQNLSTFDGIDKIEFDVFGFSRGAAAARHCINEILLEQKGLFVENFLKEKYSIELHPFFDWQDSEYYEIHFAGLFDTVAAIASLWDGMDPHDDDNGEVKLWLDPKRVKQAVHLIAHHKDEFRYNFSLNQLNNASQSPSSQFVEITLPGVHSDIGGGYFSRQFFSGALQKYDKQYLDTKRVAAYSSFLRTRRDQSDDEAARNSNAFKKIIDESQRLIKGNWCSSSQLTIKYVIRSGHHSSKRAGTSRDRISVELFMSRVIEGDLSRLSLRLMAGLAEFKGVLWDDEAGATWEEPNYKVVDFNSAFDVNGLSFSQVCKDTLVQAKQGKILPELLNQEFHLGLRRHFVHYSSDCDFISGTPIIPNKANENFTRVKHPCKQGT